MFFRLVFFFSFFWKEKKKAPEWSPEQIRESITSDDGSPYVPMAVPNDFITGSLLPLIHSICVVVWFILVSLQFWGWLENLSSYLRFWLNFQIPIIDIPPIKSQGALMPRRPVNSLRYENFAGCAYRPSIISKLKHMSRLQNVDVVLIFGCLHFMFSYFFICIFFKADS